MGWFHRRCRPLGAAEEKTPYHSDPWSALALKADVAPHQRQGAVVEASRRVVAAIQSADWGATQLSRRIATLTVWLGVFTVLIFVPTVILVLLGMTELGWVP
jgi:hypothetical protein